VIAIALQNVLLRRRRNASAPTDMAGVESSAIDLDIDAEGVDHQPIALGSAAGTFGIDDLGDLSDAAIATPPAATLPVSPGPDGPLAGTAPIELDPKTQEDLTEGPHAVTKGATDDAGDDGADYWFWEAATSLGPKRRIACMTDTTFHLHETTIEGFQPMLDRLVEVGPDVALAQAFVRLPIALVERAVREGTTLHLEGRGPDGRRRRSIELGDGVDGVAEMLARRVPVVLARASEDAGR